MATKPQKYSIFVWEGLDKRGNKTRGETSGTSPALIKATLRRQGINPLKVHKKPVSLFGPKKQKIKSKDIAVFSRQLATMMTAGVPLVQSFDIIGRGHSNPSMQQLILSIKSDVESGTNLAEAMAKHPRQFDDLFCNLVNAGEQSGALEALLHKIAIYKEKIEAIKGKIKKALFYPVAVVVVAFIITTILMIFVIPQFAELFNSFGADLPALTQLVIQMSEFFQEYWWAMFGGIIGAVYFAVFMKRKSPGFNNFLDAMSLKLPVVGEILTKATIARYARTLATMFAAGMPLVDSLNTVAKAVGNSVYEKKILRMRDEVSTGQQLNLSMQNTQLFPSMVTQMVAIGEETGAIDAMLGKVADFYEEEVDNTIDGLTSLLEPLIMAFLGVVIGGLVIAMYLPVFKMGSVV